MIHLALQVNVTMYVMNLGRLGLFVRFRQIVFGNDRIWFIERCPLIMIMWRVRRIPVRPRGQAWRSTMPQRLDYRLAEFGLCAWYICLLPVAFFGLGSPSQHP